MVLIRSVVINDSILAGIGADDLIGNKRLSGFVGFNLIKFGEIGVVVPLIVNIIADKLHGNGGLTVQAFAAASIQFAAVNAIGMYDIAESFATGCIVQIIIEVIASDIDGIYATAGELP